MSLDDPKDVLIIDDEEDVVEVLQDYCEAHGGFRFIVNAADGAVASNKLINQKFSLILLDINMPKKSGIDILREFDRYKLNSLSSVVVISGGLDKDTLTFAAKTGVKHFLVKPFDEENFLLKIKQVLK